MVNRTNYLLVKDHLRYLKDILQLSPDTINRYWFYLRHLLLWADKILLSNAQSIKPTFPVYLSTLAGRSIDKPMAFTSQKKIIQVTKRFFTWAKSEGQTGYQSLPVSWIGALHPVRQTVTSTEHEYVSVEEVIHLATLPVEEKNLALRRDQAAVAMLFLSGARATAFTTLSIEAVDIPESTIYQWPELGVETKNSKRCTTYLLQIPELLDIVQKWDAYIRSRLPSSALWYTPIKNQWGEQELSNNEPGKNRNQTLSKRLRVLFNEAGLEYKSAHKFRHGHAMYGLLHSQTMAEYKAVSMNLMHQDIKTTDQIYAQLLSGEVKQHITGLSSKITEEPSSEHQIILGGLSNSELSQLMQEAAQRLAP